METISRGRDGEDGRVLIADGDVAVRLLCAVDPTAEGDEFPDYDTRLERMEAAAKRDQEPTG